MGHFGRITSVKDLPSKKELTAVVKHAMELNDKGVKTAARPKAAPSEVIVPGDFAQALEADNAARQVFDAGSTSFKREYVMWIESGGLRAVD